MAHETTRKSQLADILFLRVDGNTCTHRMSVTLLIKCMHYSCHADACKPRLGLSPAGRTSQLPALLAQRASKQCLVELRRTVK